MPTSKTPSCYQIILPEETLTRINKLLAENPDLRLSYYGADWGTNVWTLNGSTPVPGHVVIESLKGKGIDVSGIESVVDELIKEKEKQEMRRMNLIASARAKLTSEEIEACHL